MKFPVVILSLIMVSFGAIAANLEVTAKKGQSAFLCATSLKYGLNGYKTEHLIDSLNDKIILGMASGLRIDSQSSMGGQSNSVDFGKDFTVSPQIQVHGLYACVLITK